MSRLRSLAVTLYGEPPPKDAPRSALLRWIRTLYLTQLIAMLAVYVLIVFWVSQTWIFIVLALAALIWLRGVISLSLRIRREKRR